MNREQLILRRQRLLDSLPLTAEVLRGTLLQRNVCNHTHGCTKCASGEGHPVSALTVSYPGRKTRQIGLHADQVATARRWIHNFHKLKAKIEEICEINTELLRVERKISKAGGKEP